MIKIEHLVKNYGTHCAVDDISFQVETGEIVGFLGPNGAGKSTTMNVLTGYLSSTSGNIEVDGVDVLNDPLAVKSKIGYLPEMPPLYPDMRVCEYLNFIYDLKKCTQPREEHIKQICDVVKINDVYRRIIGTLSKGYRQRVGIAQALIGNPSVIIFDEPTVGLDPKQIIEIRHLIRSLGKDHTVILSTHILQEVQATCDRIVIINKGKIVADEKAENISRVVADNRRFHAKICGPQKDVLNMLKSRPGIAYCEALAERDGDAVTYLIESEPGTDIRKNLFYTLAERNWPLIGLEAQGMNLEDIFLNVVNLSDKEEEKPTRYKSAPRPERKNGRISAEAELAGGLVAQAAEKRAEEQPLLQNDDNAAAANDDRAWDSHGKEN